MMIEATCHDCGAIVGAAHDADCGVARCLVVGLQRLACKEDHHHGRDVWLGYSPHAIEAAVFRVPADDLHPPEFAWDREALIWQRRLFRCPACGKVSGNIDDLREGYCGACHDWTGHPSTVDHLTGVVHLGVVDEAVRLRAAALGHVVNWDEPCVDSSDGEMWWVCLACRSMGVRPGSGDDRLFGGIVSQRCGSGRGQPSFLDFGTPGQMIRGTYRRPSFTRTGRPLRMVSVVTSGGPPLAPIDGSGALLAHPTARIICAIVGPWRTQWQKAATPKGKRHDH